VFKLPTLTETLGFGFDVKQVNQSVSGAGVIRGIHWADVPPGQAKYVFCSKGSIWDAVVDIRVGSATFGQFEGELISAENGKCVLIREGLGHVFLSLEDETVVNYLCSEPFSPATEHGINPLDTDLAIPFEEILGNGNFRISEKDLEAPSLATMLAEGRLPSFAS
jgi:dTDP-4-dehydrorhamnose 3,5-epimerase